METQRAFAQEAEAPTVRFAAVQVVDSSTPGPERDGLELAIGGITVRVRAGFDAGLLGQVIAVLRDASC